MPSPLRWNEHRQWGFDISLSHPEIFLLRDHITLLTDLSKDWVTGPPAEYHRFVPITYALKLAFRDMKLALYLNDHNVIDHPSRNEHNST